MSAALDCTAACSRRVPKAYFGGGLTLKHAPLRLSSAVQGAIAAGMRVVVVPSLVDHSEYPTPDLSATQGVVQLSPSLLAWEPTSLGLPGFTDTLEGVTPLEPVVHIRGTVVKGFGRGSKVRVPEPGPLEHTHENNGQVRVAAWKVAPLYACSYLSRCFCAGAGHPHRQHRCRFSALLTGGGRHGHIRGLGQRGRLHTSEAPFTPRTPPPL